MQYELIAKYDFNPFDPNFVRNVIFRNRNVEPSMDFLAPTKGNLYNYELLHNLKRGSDLINKHKENNIFLVVDSDVDGYTSAAIFYNYLKKMHPNINIEWMVHEGKEHGVTVDKVPVDTDLLVLIDAGSNQLEEHEILSAKGMNILVIDHHETEKESEHAVIINNQLSPNYPNKRLSGAGVMYKFATALDDYYGQHYADYFLDLAALGIIADMMEVNNLENRFIITEGLKNVNNPFFNALIQKQQFSLGSQPLNSIGVMFYIAPLINALIRVGTMEEKELMFNAFINGDQLIPSTKRGSSAGEQETVAAQAARICANAKSRQKKIVDQLQGNIEEIIHQEGLLDDPVLIVKLPEADNRNIIGLAANQVAHKHQKPTLVLVSDDKGAYSGSGRNFQTSEIDNFKDILNESSFFEFAEGHQSAFGAKIKEENIDKFMEFADTIFNDQFISDIYFVDFLFKGNDLQVDIIKEIVKFQSLWGKGFDEPYIAVTDLSISPLKFTFMGKGKNHLKFEHNNIAYIFFNINTEKFRSLMNNVVFDIVGRCSINVWNGRITYQIIVKDYTMKESEDKGFAI